MAMNFSEAAQLIREIPDYPKPGILFRDITPLLADSQAFAATVSLMAELAPEVEYIAGAEARGFIFASALAIRKEVGFIPLRKPGKLPGQVLSIEYGLEYGQDSLHVHTGLMREGASVLFIDDVLATGGTASAGISLLKKCGAEVASALFLLEIEGLEGRKMIQEKHPELSITSLVHG